MTICVPCQLEYQMHKVGVGLETMRPDGPYKLYSADLLRCPGCGHQIARPNPTAIAEHFQPEYGPLVHRYEERNRLVRSWATTNEKEQFHADSHA